MSDLQALLRCPSCRGELAWGESLTCSKGHSFAVVDGIPVLVTEAKSSAEAHQHAHQRDHYDREFSDSTPYRLENWQRGYLRRIEALWEGARPAGPFLDCGAGGSAYTVIETARRGIPAVGCDLSLEGMKRARRNAISEGVADRCLFVVCGAENLPFADGAFGATVSIAVLEHLEDDRSAIAELTRVTARGGRIFLAVPNSLNNMPLPLRQVYRWHDRRVGHLRHYSSDGLAERCAERGLRVVRTDYSAHWIKVWQLGAHLAASRLKLNDDRLWWWCEARDLRASNRRNGMHLSLILERPRPGG